MKMRERKGVSKAIWIIIVIVIGVIAALILVTGFRGSWDNVTNSVSGVIGNTTDSIGGLVPEMGKDISPEGSNSLNGFDNFLKGSITEIT